MLVESTAKQRTVLIKKKLILKFLLIPFRNSTFSHRPLGIRSILYFYFKYVINEENKAIIMLLNIDNLT